MRTPVRPFLIAAAIAGVLWLLSGLVNVVASNVYVHRALGLLVPSPTDAPFWTWPMPWSSIALLLAAVAVAACVVAVSGAIERRRSPGFASVWLATVAAGALVGLAIDAASVLDAVAVGGWRAIAVTSVERAVVGAYWGLVQGWVPALIAARFPSRNASTLPDGARATRLRRAVPIAAGVLVAFVVASTLGAQATQRAIVAEQELADPAIPELGAAPDPNAEGRPPASVAPSSDPHPADWCTPEQAMLLSGEEDAASGHRVLSMRISNYSDEPCVVEGYPDIAFADQNGNELDVAIERGSSFMAQDAGAQRVEIPAQGYAIAFVGWDANATDGALVARTVYAAQAQGYQRGSWPVELDVTAGSSVEITAWRLDEFASVAD